MVSPLYAAQCIEVQPLQSFRPRSAPREESSITTWAQRTRVQGWADAAGVSDNWSVSRTVSLEKVFVI